MKKQFNLVVLAMPLLLLAGCASYSPAPVSDRGSPTAVEKPAVVEVKPGYYMVKKGDTLRSIALDHGQDYKEVTAWNSIENPNLIKIGQVLRVAPPAAAPVATTEGEGGVEMRPIAPPTQIESRSVDNKSAVITETLKREPKGGTQQYSNEAWAQIQKPATSAVAAASSTATTVTPTTTSASTPTPTRPSETAPAATTAVGQINWSWPSVNKVTTPYSEGGSKGLDFDGKNGEPVLAAASGKVTLVTNSLRGYGNLIVIKHNTSYLSVYAHNSKMLVTEGQAVNKGQKIAEIGSTDSDRPNLHFEIRREGKPVDPAKFLPQR